MSVLSRFYTYEVMDNAIISSVSSEETNHPAEHAIRPLEPNFAWQTDENGVQHVIVIDLGASHVVDGYSFIHHETESEGPSPVYSGISITCESSNNALNWTTQPIEDAYGDAIDDGDDFVHLIKIRHLTNAPTTARYWRFTVAGLEYPFYAPEDARISMLWLFTYHFIDKGPGTPLDDVIAYPGDVFDTSCGSRFTTGHSINPSTISTRTWGVSHTEYDILLTAIKKCNGGYRPFLLVENDGEHRLCQFVDSFEETILDTDFYLVTAKITQWPIVQKDKVH